MNADTLLFFEKSPAALPLYQALETRVLAEFPDVKIRVQKTQISFSQRRNFAFASLLPARKAGERPAVFITVTFGLGRRVDSPRIDGSVEPYPNRWTHHVMVSSEEELDGELMDWLREAAAFYAAKR